MQVTKAQGKELLNLRHLQEIVESSVARGDRMLTLDLHDHRVIVLDIRAAVAAHERLLKRHRIPADRSPDLENGAPPPPPPAHASRPATAATAAATPALGTVAKPDA